jgi:DNA-binding NarL/FixJ family response regulator
VGDPSRPEPVRVVVVHANALGAETLQVALDQDEGVEVVGRAVTCVEAVESAMEHDADLVLIDAAVDDDEGPVVAAAVHEKLARVALLMLVDEGSDRVTHAAVRAGCSGVVPKAGSVADVANAIRRAADGEVLLGADVLARLIPLQSARGIGTDLTRRELEVLGLLRDGASTDDISRRLHVSRHTVRNHIRRVLTKLGTTRRLEAVAVAVRHGLIDR